MEYVNINRLVSIQKTPNEDAQRLIQKFSTKLKKGHVLTTDHLELLVGQDIVDQARSSGEVLVPLMRAADIKETSTYPKRVLLELTSKCNSDCTMCPRTILTREEMHMDTELAKRTIDDLAVKGISGLWLYNIGESLLHKDFFKILKHCRTYDSLGTIWLSTNGQIMAGRMIEKILQTPPDILNYSVNSMSEKHYSKMCPGLNFNKVQANLKKLISEKEKAGNRYPLIRAQMIEIPDVKHEIDDFKKEFGHLVDILSVNILEVFSQNVEANNEKDEIEMNSSIQTCNRLDREDFFIFSDGSVSCCDTDFNCKFNIGNILRQTVQQIFDGEIYQNLISQYRNGRLHEQDLCSVCKDYNL